MGACSPVPRTSLRACSRTPEPNFSRCSTAAGWVRLALPDGRLLTGSVCARVLGHLFKMRHGYTVQSSAPFRMGACSPVPMTSLRACSRTPLSEDGDVAGEKWLRPGCLPRKESLSPFSFQSHPHFVDAQCTDTRRRCDASLGPSVLTSQAHVDRLSPCLRFCDGSRAPRVAGARDSGSPDMCTGPAVRCLTFRSREEPGVRSHSVSQVPPDDCVACFSLMMPWHLV